MGGIARRLRTVLSVSLAAAGRSRGRKALAKWKASWMGCNRLWGRLSPRRDHHRLDFRPANACRRRDAAELPNDALAVPYGWTPGFVRRVLSRSASAMSEFNWAADAVLLADLLIRVGFSIRIIMRPAAGRRCPWPGSASCSSSPSQAAVVIPPHRRVTARPRTGGGGRRPCAIRTGVGTRRRARRGRSSPRNWPFCGSRGWARSSVGNFAAKSAPGRQSEIHLRRDAGEAFPALIRDIDAARHTCHLEFYIWDVGGKADEVVEAAAPPPRLWRVTCRVLVDAVGSKRSCAWSDRAQAVCEPHRNPATGGPAGHTALRLLFVRADLRLHRADRGHRRHAGLHRQPQPWPIPPSSRRTPESVSGWIAASARCAGRPWMPWKHAIFLYDWELETGRRSTEGTGEPH